MKKILPFLAGLSLGVASATYVAVDIKERELEEISKYVTSAQDIQVALNRLVETIPQTINFTTSVLEDLRGVYNQNRNPVMGEYVMGRFDTFQEILDSIKERESSLQQILSFQRENLRK